MSSRVRGLAQCMMSSSYFILLTSFLPAGKLCETRECISSSLDPSRSRMGPLPERIPGGQVCGEPRALPLCPPSLETVPSLNAIVYCAQGRGLLSLWGPPAEVRKAGGPHRVREARADRLHRPSLGEPSAPLVCVCGCPPPSCSLGACPVWGKEGRVPGRQEDWPQLQSWSEDLLISRLHREAEVARAQEMVSMTTAATHSPSRM